MTVDERFADHIPLPMLWEVRTKISRSIEEVERRLEEQAEGPAA